MYNRYSIATVYYNSFTLKGISIVKIKNIEITTISLARCTVSKNMHKKPQPPSLIIYFLIQKVLV
jgi:hypothetical protein